MATQFLDQSSQLFYWKDQWVYPPSGSHEIYYPQSSYLHPSPRLTAITPTLSPPTFTPHRVWLPSLYPGLTAALLMNLNAVNHDISCWPLASIRYFQDVHDTLCRLALPGGCCWHSDTLPFLKSPPGEIRTRGASKSASCDFADVTTRPPCLKTWTIIYMFGKHFNEQLARIQAQCVWTLHKELIVLLTRSGTNIQIISVHKPISLA